MNRVESGNILVVWDRIGDYHRARVRALKELVNEEQVFTADFGGEDGLYGWGRSAESNRHFVLSTKPVEKLDLWNRVRRFWKLLKEKQIRNVAIAGYGRLEYILFIKLAWMRGCRVTLFAESWYGENWLLNRAKGFFLRIFCQRFFVSGSRARDHFHKKLGIPQDRILVGYSVVDNDHFATSGSIRREPVLLSVARFSPEKNLGMLIAAFRQSELASSWRLRLIGGGPEEKALRDAAGGSDRVEFVGWVGYEALPGEYARASAFVLPSTFEPWGLVVNEAMAAGLPVICSDACGCQPDLVDEESGWLFHPCDESALVTVLNGLPMTGTQEWLQMSERSRQRVSQFNCSNWALYLQESFK
ncbi:MAG: glycosyltransferase family 4 protein [Puniceicoccaceae bacterium]